MKIEQRKQLLEETTKQLLDEMGFKSTVYTAIDATTSQSPAETTISVEVKLSDPKDSNYLIGKHGKNLAAFQHLCRVLIKKKTIEKISFSVDINDYRNGQRQTIIKIAREMAKKAMDDKKAVVLRPMSAFERRLVHIELEKIEGVKTESLGEGDDRKVVIKPVSILE
jgi:spoIIIJ-associated protein